MNQDNRDKNSADLPEPVRFRIPEITLETKACKDGSHLVRLRAAGIFLQTCSIPGGGKFPKLIEPDQGSDRMTLLSAPLLHLFFRPEEEHVLSSEDNVVPPF